MVCTEIYLYCNCLCSLVGDRAKLYSAIFHVMLNFHWRIIYFVVVVSLNSHWLSTVFFVSRTFYRKFLSSLDESVCIVVVLFLPRWVNTTSGYHNDKIRKITLCLALLNFLFTKSYYKKFYGVLYKALNQHQKYEIVSKRPKRCGV